jgi:cytochrome c7-like protein
MSSRIVTLVLAVALGFGVLALVPRLGALRLPGNQQGFEPEQPIAYSHRLHAGELQMPCVYCHMGTERSRYAGVPAASTCMNCHRFVTATRAAVRAEEAKAKAEKRKPRRVISPELAKLYDALGLGPDLKPDPRRTPKPIQWARVHRLPDFAAFDHRPHVSAGIACQTCHGPVETMERMRQFQTLTMGWCLDCHRTGVPAKTGTMVVAGSTDCASCHY